jgi:hypothetical protein
MGDYLRIARVYVRGPAAAVWCFLFFGLLVGSAIGAELARSQGALLGAVLSKKSCMGMFAYFNACVLGVLLRDNMAHPWASLLPHYRKKHLLVTALIALVFLGVPMFSMELVGTSDIAPTSVAVIFVTCLAAGLWTLHRPLLGFLGFLAFPFLIFAFAHSSSSPVLAAFLAGKNPAVSLALVFISFVALGAFAWRLLALKEDTFEYAIARRWGDLLGGRGQAKTLADYLVRGRRQTLQGRIDDILAALPAERRAALQNVDLLKNWFGNLKQVDNLSGYSERSLWQRLQLWRLGTAPTRTSVSVGSLMVNTLIMIPAIVFMQRLVGAEPLPARDAVVIFSVWVMMHPVDIWLPWIMRRQRLGYESLRPRTRQEFVRELGLALLWDIIQCWLGGVLLMGIAAAFWAPELLQVKNVILFISGTGVGQLGAVAMMGIWLLKPLKQGMVASVLCAGCAFGAMLIWIVFVVMNGSIAVEVKMAIASILAAASGATIPLAYGRWCRADLD